MLCVHIGTTRLQGLGTSGGGLWSWACHLAPTGQLRGPPDLQAAVVAAGDSRSLPPPLTSELHRRGAASSAVAGSVPGSGLKGKAAEAALHGLPAMPAVKAIPILSA